MTDISTELHNTTASAEGRPEDTCNIAADMRELEAMEADTSPTPERMESPQLEEIELFQVRAGITTFHVESLARALSFDGDLQPLLVLRRGGRTFLIDGRHRKRAYEIAGRGDSIPIAVFHGTPQEALLEGQRLNKRHTLAMTKDERMDGAWKLVKLDAAGASRFTLEQIVAAGVSRAQVTFMRKVLREVEDVFECLRLLADSHPGDVLLVEQVDRLSRLNTADWERLRGEIRQRQVKVVALDLPTSWQLATANADDFTARMAEAINGMLLDMLAAIARKDYEDRRRRQAQGIATAKADGRYAGRPENTEKNAAIIAMLQAGQSWNTIVNATGCSRSTLARLAKRATTVGTETTAG